MKITIIAENNMEKNVDITLDESEYNDNFVAIYFPGADGALEVSLDELSAACSALERKRMMRLEREQLLP